MEKTDTEFVELHYSKKEASEYEKYRLSRSSPVEFLITKRLLKKYLPNKTPLKILEVGVGYGDYSEFLLKNFNSKICLCDLTKKFLDETSKRLKKVKLDDKIISVTKCCATELTKYFKNDFFDAVLFLGPLYHLCLKSERIKAIKAAIDVLKENGIVFFAGINRIAVFRDLMKFASDDKDFLKGKNFGSLIETGVITKEMKLPIGTAYLTTFKEFNDEILENKNLKKIKSCGVESFTTVLSLHGMNSGWNRLTKENQEQFVGFVEKTMEMPEGYGRSDHFVFIGKKSKAV